VWRIGIQDLEDFIEEAYRKAEERIAAGSRNPLPGQGVVKRMPA
jgi:hypothetical protein